MMRVAFEQIYCEGLPEDLLLEALDQFCQRNSYPMQTRDPRIHDGLKISDIRIHVQCDDKEKEARMMAVIAKYQKT